MKEDDGSFLALSNVDVDLGLRHKDTTVEEMLVAYGKVLGVDIPNDEFVNRFEPALTNCIMSAEEMGRFLDTIGVNDPSGSVLWGLRELSKPEANVDISADESFLIDVKELMKKEILRKYALLREDDTNLGYDDIELLAISRASLLVELNR